MRLPICPVHKKRAIYPCCAGAKGGKVSSEAKRAAAKRNIAARWAPRPAKPP